MSNTNAKSSDTAYYVKLSLTLLIISLVVAVLLGVVNGVTAGPIETIKAEKKAAAMSVVMQDCTFEEVTASDEMSAAATGFESKIAGIYAATGADGSKAGYVLEVIPSGFGGDIDMMVGISAEGTVTGVTVVSATETAGVGTKVTDNKNNKNGVPVLDQFKDKSLSKDGELSMGVNVDAISGATVTSKAVTRGVNAALAVYALLG